MGGIFYILGRGYSERYDEGVLSILPMENRIAEAGIEEIRRELSHQLKKAGKSGRK